MMAMIFIDDSCYPYKTCFLLAIVLSNWYHSSYFLLHIHGFRNFTCLAALKKKSHRLKLQDEIISFLTVPLMKVYVAWNLWKGNVISISYIVRKMNPSPAKDADLWDLGMILALVVNSIQITWKIWACALFLQRTYTKLMVKYHFHYGQPKIKEGSLFKFREAKSAVSNS